MDESKGGTVPGDQNGSMTYAIQATVRSRKGPVDFKLTRPIGSIVVPSCPTNECSVFTADCYGRVRDNSYQA